MEEIFPIVKLLNGSQEYPSLGNCMNYAVKHGELNRPDIQNEHYC